MSYNREMAKKKKLKNTSAFVPAMEPNHNVRRPSRSPMPVQSESDQEIMQDLRPDRPIGIERIAVTRPGNSGTRIMLNIIRAICARALFIVHSLTTIWMTADVRKENEIWTFALISVSIIIEGSYAIIMRAGDERKWFSPSVLLYILATVPPIWLLETAMCEWRVTARELLSFHI